MKIECLESRIAPASITFNDIDGDLVTITSSKGTADDLTNGALFSAPIGSGKLLLRLDFTAAVFQGSNVAITAKRDVGLGGDGFVSVGYVGATGRDLGTVVIDGDLGAIDAGDAANPAISVKGLLVQSLGRLGTAYGAPDLVSNIDGGMGKLVVKSDMVGAFLSVVDSSGAGKGRIGSVTILGSLIGGADASSGSLYGADGLGAVKIGGDIAGGSGLTSGSVTSERDIKSVTVNGSIFGGFELTSGVIFSSFGALGPVKIGGDIIGGVAGNSGRVFGATGIASITLGGSLMGGAAEGAGLIHTDGAIGKVVINGDLKGGGGFNSGTIISPASLGSVTIHGSMLGGSINQTGAVVSNGPIKAVTVDGSLIGGTGSGSSSIFTIGVLGPVKIGGDLIGLGPLSASLSGGEIKSVSIGGSMIGGSGQDSGSIDSIPGSIGRITIGGDVRGGSGPSSGSIRTQKDLGSVIIGGTLAGGTGNLSGGLSADFGTIGSVKIGGDLLGADNGLTGDVIGSGYIEGKRLGAIFVDGSIRAGTDRGTGGLFQNAAIVGQDGIGSVTVKGSLLGTPHADGDSADGNYTHVTIAALGIFAQAGDTKVPLSIGSVTVGGQVVRAQILAGFLAPYFSSYNGDAQIGRVTVGGDWVASRIAASTQLGADNLAGTSDDTFLSGVPEIQSLIASITIKGKADGTLGSGDSFRFMAEHIGKVKIGATTFPLTVAADNFTFSSTLDVHIVDNG